MTTLYVLNSLLIGAALCFGLGRVLPTRFVGVGAVVVCVGAAIVLFASAGSTPALLTLVVIGDGTMSIGGANTRDQLVAAVLLASASTVLLALAGAVATGVRGFGALFGWALLCVAAALLSLLSPTASLIQPAAWALLATTGYAALRASGAKEVASAAPVGVSLGLLAAALLAVVQVIGAETAGALLAGSRFTAAVGILAAFCLVGAPPLLVARTEATAGPAPLGALLFGLCGPAAGLGWLLRAATDMPASLGVLFGLVGSLGALGSAAGLFGEQRLRPILAWTAGAQASLVVVAAGLGEAVGIVAGFVLLAALMLSTALGAAAALSVARATGDDDFRVGAAPRAAAVVWAAGALASLGLPPFWGFWGRRWLFEAALEQQPWLAGPLVAGALLLALGLLAPLAGLWRSAPSRDDERFWGNWLPAVLVLVPLLLPGFAPALAWPLEPGAESVRAGRFDQALVVAAGLFIVACFALILRTPPAREAARDSAEDEVYLAPEALGATLRPLAWFANPQALLRAGWRLLERAGDATRLVVSLFEQRYYLLGVLAALITIMLLMAQ